MTQQSILVSKIFLSLNIPVFSSFFIEKNATPRLKKGTISLPAAPSKNWGSVKPPLLENSVRGSTSTPPPPTPPKQKEGEGGAQYGDPQLG